MKLLLLSYINIVVTLRMGIFSDFKGELQVLKDQKWVSKIIYTILRTTLNQALIEPQLFKDLKNC